MAIERTVPLDAAGEPCVADGQVGKLQDRVVEKQFLPAALVIERNHPSAERRVEDRPQRRVLNLNGRHLAGPALPRVVVLHEIRQRRNGGVGEHTGAVFHAEIVGDMNRRFPELEPKAWPEIGRSERSHWQCPGTGCHAGLVREHGGGAHANHRADKDEQCLSGQEGQGSPAAVQRVSGDNFSEMG